MEFAEFTFLNTTGASLSQPAAKRMRAHITKTNFAKRRQRLSKPTGIETESRTKRTRTTSPESHPDVVLPPIPTQPDLAANITAFHKLQELVFLEGRHSPDSPSEAVWFNLIASDPALVEATMAVAVRQWSPDNSWQSKADYHSYIAVNLIKQRITSTTTRTDGVLGAVITMAFGAALAQDDYAWNVHIDGLAHIIKDRESRNPHTMPTWFLDLVVQDSINSIFNYPRVWHQSIIQALGDYHDQRILQLAAIHDSVVQLQNTINSHRKHPSDAAVIAQVIEEPLARLHYETRSLRTKNNPHIDAAARSIELVLYLLWPSQTGAHLTLLAGELGDAMSRYPIKGCSYMDLTSFQLMIGAVAADKGSPARTWFVDRLSRAVRWMQTRGWREPLNILQRRFMSDVDVGLMGRRFKDLWKELHDIDVTLEFQSSVETLQ
ncbi:hypothetical protein BDW59DRAFT_167841 [Aspergillus cavernicola]|uniref:Fungal-specific transcription factor domain-containing protein n=1 Tax=Aspergillus cavernicola TaxID=176166 RepID=A0ABR4HA57_9EURO